MTKRLSDFDVLTFDCYGTLIDWETGMWDAYQELLMANRRTDIDRSTMLRAHAKHESLLQAAQPRTLYPEILAETHRRVAAGFGLETQAGLDGAFGGSVPNWPAFHDTADALRRLQRHFKLVILSNVDRTSFAGSNRKLGVDFDAVYTAEEIGSYKPASHNFEYLLTHLADEFAIESARILHTAQSLFHDHVPASEIGLATAWIDRQHLSDGGDWGATALVPERPQTDFLYFTLAEMAAAADGG